MRKGKVIKFYSPINSGGCADYTLEITEFKNGKRRFRATQTICSQPYLYVSSTNMTEKDRNKFLDDYGIDGTPVVLFFKNGRETSTLKRIVGNQDADTVVSKLKANGLIEK